MNCVSGDPPRHLTIPTGLAWYELGSVILYGTAIGVSILMALADLRTAFS